MSAQIMFEKIDINGHLKIFSWYTVVFIFLSFNEIGNLYENIFKRLQSEFSLRMQKYSEPIIHYHHNV